MPGKRFSKAEEEYLRGNVSRLMGLGLGIDRITATLKVPRATIAVRMRAIRKEALRNHESFMESLPLELQNALDNLGMLYSLGYNLYNDPNARMSFNSRVQLLNTLKEMINSRVAVLSNVSIIEDIQTYTQHQRSRLELMRKQALSQIHDEEKTIDEKMAEEGIISISSSSSSNQSQNQSQQEQEQQQEGQTTTMITELGHLEEEEEESESEDEEEEQDHDQ